MDAPHERRIQGSLAHRPPPTAKYHADPFVRNAAGEDSLRCSGCLFRSLHLRSAGALRSRTVECGHVESFCSIPALQIIPGRGPYEPLALHTTVPVILHENQRLDTDFKL